MYSKSALATFGDLAYLATLSLAILMKGPSFWDNMLAVPRRTKRPEAAETGLREKQFLYLKNCPNKLKPYLAVFAVLGVFKAASMVLGRPPWLPGLTTPLNGLPVLIMCLRTQ
jgi:hypothetical protein